MLTDYVFQFFLGLVIGATATAVTISQTIGVDQKTIKKAHALCNGSVTKVYIDGDYDCKR